jgi:hypothetical protein
VRHLPQNLHLLLQVGGKSSQFVGQDAETKRRLTSALGQENGIHRHQVDLERGGHDALDLFVDPHDAAQLTAGSSRLGHDWAPPGGGKLIEPPLLN